MKITFFSLFMIFNLILKAQNIPLYVGTYTNDTSKGIYSYDFNTETGEITNQKLAVKVTNPSYLAYSTNRKFLYAVSEVADYKNIKSGFVSAFSVTKNGLLQFINSVSSNGAHPCHIQLNDKNAVISNYTGGTISIHKVEKNGEIKPAYQIIDHNIPSKKSHTHSTKFLNNELFVADLGLNFLAHYVKKGQKYVLNEKYLIGEKSGPRHFEISKKGDFIYVINELNSTITVLKKGIEKYTQIQNISTLKANFEGESFCADIHLSQNENYLYGSNRGENSIVVFKRDLLNGTIQKIQSISVEGNWPRNFTITPNGKFLLVANKKSKNISVYKVYLKTGKLTFLYSKKTPTPVCLLF